MLFLLGKILTPLVLPLGLALGAGLLALASLARGRSRTAAGLLALSLVWLWGWSTPLVSGVLSRTLTARYPPQRAEVLPAADAIVLLGGGVYPITGDMASPDMRAAADRVWHAARLYQAGKAPLILACGGKVWDSPNTQPEADAMQTLLNAFGVPDSAIVTESASRNTRQNAVLSAGLAAERGIRRVLLVTSGWHMPRSVATFRRVGLDVIPATTDSPRLPPRPWIFAIIPSVYSLSNSSQALREHLGLLVYRLRGWA